MKLYELEFVVATLFQNRFILCEHCFDSLTPKLRYAFEFLARLHRNQRTKARSTIVVDYYFGSFDSRIEINASLILLFSLQLL